MNEEHVLLGAYWRERRITARQFIELCFNFLVSLRDFSSAFDHHCVAIGQLPDVVPVSVPKDYASFEQLMMKAVPHPERAYTNPDPANRHFTLESTHVSGFSVAFSDAGQEGIRPTELGVYVAAGGHGKFGPPDSVLIEIPPDYREFWYGQRAKELMRIVVSAWQPSFATLTSRELRKALDAERKNNITLGVVTFFSDRAAGDVAKECASVETLPNGGVLISVEDVPSPWAESVDRFRPCYSRLNNAGLLKLVA
jgi:hypothetical protein